MELWAITESTYGAHEPDPFISIWSTKDLAEREVERLKAERLNRYKERAVFYVKPIVLDSSHDEPPLG